MDTRRLFQLILRKLKCVNEESAKIVPPAKVDSIIPMARNTSRFNSVSEIKKYFVDKGSKLVSIIDEEGGEGPVDRVPGTKEKIVWLCASNISHRKTTTLSAVTRRDDAITLTCASCSKKKGKDMFGIFQKDLKTKGWKMVSKKTDYKNNKSRLNVECDQGHATQISHNQLSNGHGCKECARTKQRVHTIESVRTEFLEKGYELLEDKYINNATLMKYRCKCGRETSVSYSNFSRYNACKDCSRRWTIKDVTDFMEERGCKFTSTDSEEFVTNTNKVSYVCVCGLEGTNNWKSFKNGSRCVECTKQLIQNTCMVLYGTDNPSKNEDIKKKIRDTTKEHFGEEFAMRVEELKQRSIQTNISNHGGQHNLALPETREQADIAYVTKYGDRFGHVKEHREKSQTTSMRLYGGKTYTISPVGRQNRLERTGYEHPSQNPETFFKQQAASYLNKPYICPSGKIVFIQGYEGFALRDIFFHDIQEEDVKIGREITSIPYEFEGKSRNYFPDIYIESLDLLIEIKSTWTYKKDYEKNIKKFQAAAQLHNFVLWVYDPKGINVLERFFYKTSSLVFVS